MPYTQKFPITLQYLPLITSKSKDLKLKDGKEEEMKKCTVFYRQPEKEGENDQRLLWEEEEHKQNR